MKTLTYSFNAETASDRILLHLAAIRRRPFHFGFVLFHLKGIIREL